jgi:serine/threonine-protein kinase HipA
LDKKVIENIFGKYKKLIPKWGDIINQSFLSESMKEEYKGLLKRKAVQIDL